MKKLFILLSLLLSFTTFGQVLFPGGVDAVAGLGIRAAKPADDRTVVADSTKLPGIHDNFKGLISTDISTEPPTIYVRGNSSSAWYKVNNNTQVFSQNNTGKVITLNSASNGTDATPTLAQVAESLNRRSRTVSQFETPVIIKFNYLSSPPKTYLYLFSGGKGTYGLGGTQILESQLLFLNSQTTTPADIAGDSNTQTIPLGTLPDGNYIVAANSQSRDLSNNSVVYFFSYTKDSILYLVQFINPAPGIYGGSGTQLVAGDFSASTNSGVTPATGTVTNVTGVAGQVTVGTGTTTPTIGIDPAYTTARNAYTNSQISALTTDVLAETIANKYISVANVLPTIAVGKIGYNTTFSTVQGTDNTGVWNKGLFYSDGVRSIPLNLPARSGGSITWIGHSIVNSFGLSSVNQGYPTKVSNFIGATATINGVDGAVVPAHYKGLYSTVTSDIICIDLGINDARTLGTPGITPYINMMMGMVTSYNTTAAVKGVTWVKATPGDWTADSVFFNTSTSAKTTVNNSPATQTFAGDVVFVTVAYEQTNDASYTVTIDGVLKGTFSANTTGLTPYPNPVGSAPDANYYPYTHRFPNLGQGLHSVVVQKVSGTAAIRLIGGLSNGALKVPYGNKGLSVYVASLLRMNAGSYPAYSGNIAGLSDVTIYAYNTALKSLVTTLALDGFQVKYVDTNKFFEPNVPANVRGTTDFHPSAVGHTLLANTWINEFSTFNLAEKQLSNSAYELTDSKLDKATAMTSSAKFYSTADQTTNTGYLELGYITTNTIGLLSKSTGTGIAPNITIGGQAPVVNVQVFGTNVQNFANNFITSYVPYQKNNTLNNTTGLNYAFGTFNPTLNLSGTGTAVGYQSYAYVQSTPFPYYSIDLGTSTAANGGGTRTPNFRVNGVTGYLETASGASFASEVTATNATQNSSLATFGQLNMAVNFMPYTAKTAAYTITTTDNTVTLTSGSFAFTLPTAVGITGKSFVLKNKGTGILTVNFTSGQTADGLTTFTLSENSTVVLESNGVTYDVVGSYFKHFSVNSTTTALSSPSLNSTYPNVPVSHRVLCALISTGGKIYTKYSENGTTDVWQVEDAPIVPQD